MLGWLHLEPGDVVDIIATTPGIKTTTLETDCKFLCQFIENFGLVPRLNISSMVEGAEFFSPNALRVRQQELKKALYMNDVYQDNQGMLWGLGRYLQKFNPYNAQYESWPLPQNHRLKASFNEFISACDAENGKLYVGNQSGLFLFDKSNHTFEKINININKVNDKALNDVRTLEKINDPMSSPL